MKKNLTVSFLAVFALFLCTAAIIVPSTSWLRVAGNNATSGYVFTCTNADGSGHWAAATGGGTNFPGGASFPGDETIYWWQPNLWGNDSFVLTNNGYGVIWAFDPSHTQSTFTTPLVVSNDFRANNTTVYGYRQQPFITLPANLHFNGATQYQRTNAITGTKAILLTNITEGVDYSLVVDSTGSTAGDLVINFTGFSSPGAALTNGMTEYLIRRFGTQTNITRIIPETALVAGLGVSIIEGPQNTKTISASNLLSPLGFSMAARPGTRALVSEDFALFSTFPAVSPANSQGYSSIIAAAKYTNLFGLLSLGCTTNASAYADLPGQADMVAFGGADWYAEWAFAISNAGNVFPCSNGWLKVGFSDSRADVAAVVDGVYAQLSQAIVTGGVLVPTNVWQFVTSSNSVRTTNITATIGMTNVKQTIGVYSAFPNTNAVLYVNGTAIATNNTTVPSGLGRAMTYRMGLGASASGNGIEPLEVDVDYVWIGLSPFSLP